MGAKFYKLDQKNTSIFKQKWLAEVAGPKMLVFETKTGFCDIYAIGVLFGIGFLFK